MELRQEDVSVQRPPTSCPKSINLFLRASLGPEQDTKGWNYLRQKEHFLALQVGSLVPGQHRPNRALHSRAVGMQAMEIPRQAGRELGLLSPNHVTLGSWTVTAAGVLDGRLPH